MKKSIIFLLACIVCTGAVAQNVGISTSVPTGKLQINHKATASSPTLRLLDSAAGTGSQILFSKESQSNSFSLVSTIGVFAANNTLDFRTSFNSAMVIKGDGKVGINEESPQGALDVVGNMYLTGKLFSNGGSGITGQVLGINQSGNPVWGNSGYDNFDVLSAANSVQTWTVPAGVTKVIFEGWSGGGFGGANHYNVNTINYRGGGSGAYFKVKVNVTPGQQFAIHVPLAQTTSTDFSDKDSIAIQLSPLVGLNNKVVILNGDSLSGGRSIRATGIFSNLYCIEGNDGGISTEEVNYNPAILNGDITQKVVSVFYASGADAPYGGGGGKGGYQRLRFTAPTTITTDTATPATNGKTPGGGAAINISSVSSIAGNGMLIIHY